MPMKISEFENDVIKKKIKKFFDVKEINSHHTIYKVYYKGKRICGTYHSHGSSGKEISDGVLSKVKRQLRLDKLKQLYDLKNCPMSSEDYFKLLKQKNVFSN